MTLLSNRMFQLGIAMIIWDLIIIYSRTEKEGWILTGKVTQALGLGLVCVPIFNAPAIYSMIIAMIWLLPLRIYYALRAR